MPPPPPPMANYTSPFLMDHGGHIIGQPQPPPPQAYMSMFEHKFHVDH
jgi:hypothetical protein